MRLYNKEIDIDQDKIKSFFDKRGKNADINSILSSTMFTEKEKAEKRDLIEKELFLNNITVKPNSKVLEIGCGVGRWAKIFSNKVIYLGLDYSDELLKLAKEDNPSSNIYFQLISADNIKPDKLIVNPPFDLLIMTGLSIYINDEQLKKVFNSINEVTSKDSIIYIREPVAIDKRLTLKEFFSEELDDQYSAIYRTEPNYFEFFEIIEGFEIIKSGNLYDKNMHNRAETVHKYYILKRE